MLGSERAQRFARLEQEVARALAEAGGAAGSRERLAREYEAARGRAPAARLALLVQREAIGLRQHRVVDQQFPEPPRLR